MRGETDAHCWELFPMPMRDVDATPTTSGLAEETNRDWKKGDEEVGGERSPSILTL
jgi:hypothetical protein